MINVLIVEDSPVVREFLGYLLSTDPELHVVGIAPDGKAALAAVWQHRPDVITMDIHMPRMNGLEATRRIMETRPTPIVIVSGAIQEDDVESAFRALEAGALAALPRPESFGHPAHESTAKEFIQTVKSMSAVRVIRRWPRQCDQRSQHISPQVGGTGSPRSIQIVAIGASTGGPPALQTILAALPKDFPVPVLIVQHLAPGFVHGFATWLTQSCGFPVHVATHGVRPLPGHAYVAPDGVQCGIGRGPVILLSQEADEHGMRPSVSHLLRSVDQVFGPQAVGILLTGMGKDGVEELKSLRQHGALTFVQDKASAVVYGMPGEAVKQGAASYILPPMHIAATLTRLVHRTGTAS